MRKAVLRAYETKLEPNGAQRKFRICHSGGET